MEDQRNLPQIKVLTIKEIILTLKDYFLEIVRNYTIIIVASIPFLCYYIYNFYNTKPTYFAEVKFLVEGSSSSIGGCLVIFLVDNRLSHSSSILSSFVLTLFKWHIGCNFPPPCLLRNFSILTY